MAKSPNGKYCSPECQESGRFMNYKIKRGEGFLYQQEYKGTLDAKLKKFGCAGYVDRQKAETLKMCGRVII